MTDLIEQIADELAAFLPERDEGQDFPRHAGYGSCCSWLAEAQRHPEATRKFAADLVAAADAAEVAR